MKQKFYLDMSIWRDYYENRSDKFRPLGEWALQLLNLSIMKEYIILYSDFVVDELKITYTTDEITNIFSVFEDTNVLSRIEISQEQIKEAAILCKKAAVAFGDALHAILARDNKAVLVSRDKHFENLADIVEIKRPEELL